MPQNVDKLPGDLEDVPAFLARRARALKIKEMWRSIYTECYRYAMPSRETFTWATEGQEKASPLYDSTLQESTYTAANTLCALLFPAWTRWAELGPGGAIDENDITPEIKAGLQSATRTFFNFLNDSNFATSINEVALDLMVGTGALSFDEGTAEKPFVFTSIALSAIEIEEGPDGKIETTFLCRRPPARNLERMYPGASWPTDTLKIMSEKPEQEVEILQSHVYDPNTKSYYGVVTDIKAKAHVWRYNYGESCPMIVARATKVAGETFGRGRVMLALSDARTLDKMQEFILRHSALQIAPPATAVSDGVLNPYTAVLAPNTILPVSSNADNNPSLRVLEVGGNFQIGEQIVTALRDRIRRTMIGPEPSEGAVKSATEIAVNDRNRLWAMNGELSRIQSELLDRIVARGVFILQSKGLIPKFRVDGREVVVKYHSPFSKSQDSEDILALERTLQTTAMTGNPMAVEMGLKTELIPSWTARKAGLDETLVRSESEKAMLERKLKQLAEQMVKQMQESGGGMPDAAGMAV